MTTTNRPGPQLIGGHVALDLVNTVSWRLDSERRRDNLQDFFDLARWCCRAGLLDDVAAEQLLAAGLGHPRIAQQALQGARVLREHLYALLTKLIDGGEPPGVVMSEAGMGGLLLDALGHSQLLGFPMNWQLIVHQPADVPELLALEALDLLQSPQLHLIRRCHGIGCGWLFLDGTRNHTRRWCSSSDCGNRDRARRHYARHRGQASGNPAASAE